MKHQSQEPLRDGMYTVLDSENALIKYLVITIPIVLSKTMVVSPLLKREINRVLSWHFDYDGEAKIAIVPINRHKYTRIITTFSSDFLNSSRPMLTERAGMRLRKNLISASEKVAPKVVLRQAWKAGGITFLTVFIVCILLMLRGTLLWPWPLLLIANSFVSFGVIVAYRFFSRPYVLYTKKTTA